MGVLCRKWKVKYLRNFGLYNMILYIKFNFECIKDLSMESKIMKILEVNVVE